MALLLEMTPGDHEEALHVAEALSYMGEDEALLYLVGEEHVKGPHAAQLLHLQAVAAMRLGRIRRASQLWEEALTRPDPPQEARVNLADLQRPRGERHSPFAFLLERWLPEETVTSARQCVDRCQLEQDEGRRQGVALRCLERNPQLVALGEALLDRGDPAGRSLILALGILSRHPELVSALARFGPGERGPDLQRYLATGVAMAERYLPCQPHALLVEGRRAELVPLMYELHQEPTAEHDPLVRSLMEPALRELRERRCEAAEDLLRRAVALAPEAPDTWHNLGVALQLQDRLDEAEEVWEENLRRNPGYLFSRISLALTLLTRKEVEQVAELLDPLVARHRFHPSELSVYCVARIRLSLARKHTAHAWAWFDLWVRGVPEHPEQPRLLEEICCCLED